MSTGWPTRSITLALVSFFFLASTVWAKPDANLFNLGKQAFAVEVPASCEGNLDVESSIACIIGKTGMAGGYGITLDVKEGSEYLQDISRQGGLMAVSEFQTSKTVEPYAFSQSGTGFSTVFLDGGVLRVYVGPGSTQTAITIIQYFLDESMPAALGSACVLQMSHNARALAFKNCRPADLTPKPSFSIVKLSDGVCQTYLKNVASSVQAPAQQQTAIASTGECQLSSPFKVPEGKVPLTGDADDQRDYGSHGALDYAVSVGTPILAQCDGQITQTDPVSDGECGATVLYQCACTIKGQPAYVRLCHLSDYKKVKVGDRVKQGQVVALSGGDPNNPLSGRSSGPHVHLSLRIGSPNVGQSVDPKRFVSKTAVVVAKDESAWSFSPVDWQCPFPGRKVATQLGAITQKFDTPLNAKYKTVTDSGFDDFPTLYTDDGTINGKVVHGALDFWETPGTPIRAAASGVVEDVGKGTDCGFGLRVQTSSNVFDDDGTWEGYLYCHLQSQAAREDGTLLRTGDKVTKREIVGRVGQTGRANGPHLHFEITTMKNIEGTRYYVPQRTVEQICLGIQPPANPQVAPASPTAPKEPSVEQKIGQLLMTTVPYPEDAQKSAEFFKKYYLGGALLNYKTPDNRYRFFSVYENQPVAKTKTFVDTLQLAAPIPMFIATDAESQEVNHPGTKLVPSLQQVAKGKTPGQIEASMKKAGAELKALGINMDLGPVLDVGIQENFMFSRTLGTDAQSVAAAGSAYVKGLHESKIITIGKHFPGIGNVKKNTDFASGNVDISKTTVLSETHLKPFSEVKGLDGVMISSVTYQGDTQPAVFSEEFNRQIGVARTPDTFVITDDVGQAGNAIEAYYADKGGDENHVKRAVSALVAGNDMIIDIRHEKIAGIIQGVAEEAKTNQALSFAIETAYKRVLKLKERFAIRPSAAAPVTAAVYSSALKPVVAIKPGETGVVAISSTQSGTCPTNSIGAPFKGGDVACTYFYLSESDAARFKDVAFAGYADVYATRLVVRASAAQDRNLYPKDYDRYVNIGQMPKAEKGCYLAALPVQKAGAEVKGLTTAMFLSDSTSDFSTFDPERGIKRTRAGPVWGAGQYISRTVPTQLSSNVDCSRITYEIHGGKKLAGSSVPADRMARINAAVSKYSVRDYGQGLSSSIPWSYYCEIMAIESGFNPQAGSYAGAKGLMQIISETASGLQSSYHKGDYQCACASNPYAIEDNICCGIAYLKEGYKKFGDLGAAAARYNGGDGGAKKYIQSAGTKFVWGDEYYAYQTYDYTQMVKRFLAAQKIPISQAVS